MPPFEDELYGRNQDAVLWEFAGSFDPDGRPQCRSPVDIEVQWKQSRRKVNVPDRGLVQLAAEAVVDRKVSPSSIVWPNGTHAEFLAGTGSGSGLDDPYLHEVVSYDEEKDLRGRFTRRVIGLVRFREATPTVA